MSTFNETRKTLLVVFLVLLLFLFACDQKADETDEKVDSDGMFDFDDDDDSGVDDDYDSGVGDDDDSGVDDDDEVYNGWTIMDSGEHGGITSVVGFSSSDVYAISRDSFLHYDGETWTALNSGYPCEFYGISSQRMWGWSGDDIYVLCEMDIMHYDGDTWSSVQPPVSDYFPGIQSYLSDMIGFSDGSIVVTGKEDNYYYYSPIEDIVLLFDGQEWTKYPTPPFPGGYRLSGFSADDFYLQCTGGVILRYKNGSWSQIDTTLVANQGHNSAGMWVVSENEIYIVWHNSSNSIGDFLTVYDGYQMTTLFENFLLSSVWGTSSEDIFTRDFENGIFHFDGNEWDETYIPGVDFLTDFWGSSGTDVFIGGYEGEWDPSSTTNGVIYHYGPIE